MAKTAEGKFKVGDRVRVAKTPTNGGYGEIGDTGTIKTSDPESVYLAFDSGKWKGDSWWISTDEVEPAAPQLTIRAGAYYRTRDGRKVMVHENGNDITFPFYHDRGRGGYHGVTAAGKSCLDQDYEDLIAEWVDGPAATGDSSNADIFDEIEDWMAENPLPHVAPATSGKEDAEPDSKLLVSISADTSALDAEIDRVLKRLRKLKRRARKLGISLEYSQLREAA